MGQERFRDLLNGLDMALIHESTFTGMVREGRFALECQKKALFSGSGKVDDSLSYFLRLWMTMRNVRLHSEIVLIIAYLESRFILKSGQWGRTTWEMQVGFVFTNFLLTIVLTGIFSYQVNVLGFI